MKAIIIEDVLPEATMIKGMLNNSFPTIEIIGIASSVDEGISMILRNKPDFVLMDIEIMGGTSYDILASLRQYSIPLDFEIIFLINCCPRQSVCQLKVVWKTRVFIIRKIIIVLIVSIA